jgi:hypothetical protein
MKNSQKEGHRELCIYTGRRVLMWREKEFGGCRKSGRTVNKGSVQYVAKKMIGAIYCDVKEQRFEQTRFRTRGLGMSTRK